MDIAPQAISCESCDRMGWDEGSWSKWSPPDPKTRTRYVCQQCLSSPRCIWKELFSLCQKLGVGTVHLPQCEQSSASEWEGLCVTSYQQPEDISIAEQYQKFEGIFEHSPLDHDQIRLLSLLPSSGDLLCTIEVADLNSATAQYEALSYCWGADEQCKHTIWINGHPFAVLRTLHGALMQLRKPTSKRKLWIDAICINQVGNEGKAEKNVQIPLMSRIYQQAAGVIVWLGAAEDNSNETLDIIAQPDVEAMRSHRFATDFGRLLKRPWFRRTWIVQEFVLGRTPPRIVCGSRTISYGKFLATYSVLPILISRVHDMTFTQLRKLVDSNGNVLSSQHSKMNPPTLWKNHEDADRMLGALMNMRTMTLDNNGSLRPIPLYKILPFIKDFDATDLKDKIYGTLGLVKVSLNQSLQVNYQKSVAEVFRDAMAYMLCEEKAELGAVDIYLQYPLSLSLECLISSLPSWVPDFSQNRPFLRDHKDVTWYWLYHQSSTFSGHTSLLRRQHGRHTVSRGEINRQLLFVDDARLSVRGFLIDEVDVVVESRFFGLGLDDQDLRDYSERQMKSSSEASKHEGRELMTLLDVYAKTWNATTPEITLQAGDLTIFIATTFQQWYRLNNLHDINELCRKKLVTTDCSLDTETWLTFIWRDLLEGYPALVNMSEEDFNQQFFDIAQSERSVSGATWLSDIISGESRTVEDLPQLNRPFRELFRPPRTFFTTETSGFYGISPPGVQEGDKLAFLFPPVYMAFILRPSGEYFQMVGPCIVPPCLRDSALEKLYSPTSVGDEFVII